MRTVEASLQRAMADREAVVRAWVLMSVAAMGPSCLAPGKPTLTPAVPVVLQR